MRPHQIGGWAAVLVFVLCAETSAFAQGTEQQREACTPDAFRLCGAYIPDADRITACLRASGPQLSRPCFDVFFPPQDVVPPPRRRYRGRRLPPDYDED